MTSASRLRWRLLFLLATAAGVACFDEPERAVTVQAIGSCWGRVNSGTTIYCDTMCRGTPDDCRCRYVIRGEFIDLRLLAAPVEPGCCFDHWEQCPEVVAPGDVCHVWTAVSATVRAYFSTCDPPDAGVPDAGTPDAL